MTRSTRRDRAHVRVARALAVALLMAAGSATAAAASAAVLVPQEGAGDSVTWSVRPADETGPDGRAWVELTLDPGETAVEHLALRNLGAAAASFSLSAADGYFTDKGRFNMLPASEPSVAAGTWIGIEDAVTVEAGATVVVPFTIEVPQNATPGDHAAGVAASVFSSGAGDDGSKVSVESRVGFRVITRVTGTLQPSVAASGVDASYRYSWNPFEPGSLTVDVGVVNDGNVMVRLEHGAELPGTPVATDDEERVEMLPGDERTVSVQSRGVWPLLFARGAVVLTPDANADGSAPAERAEPVRVEFFVWTVPWPQLAVALAAVLIAGAFLSSRRRGKARVDRLVAEASEAARREALAEVADARVPDEAPR